MEPPPPVTRHAAVESSYRMASGFWRTIERTFSRWVSHNAPRLGAALSFYMFLSAAPLLIFLLLSSSWMYGQAAVEEKLIYLASTLSGPTGAGLAKAVLTSAREPSTSAFSWLIVLGTLIFGASSAFFELRDDLNTMWNAQPPRGGVWGFVVQWIFSFVLVIAAALIVIASILATAAISVIEAHFSSVVPVSPVLLRIANFIVSLAAFLLVFVLIYRFIPDRVLPWRVLWTGGAVSASLFVIGKGVIGIYLGRIGLSSLYGAAGSLIAVAFWVYYSALIFLLGAEFTYVWSERHRMANRGQRAA